MKTFIKSTALAISLIMMLASINLLGAKISYNSAGDELTPQEIEFLIAAYKDEARGEYLFKKITEKFPDATGFIKILSSEQNHVTTLEAIFIRYELEIPKNLDFSDMKIPSSVDEACTIATAYEKENVEMYKKFLNNVSNKYLKTVFEDLRDISIYRNIPAIEKCK
jgi:hypothetical protein